MTLGVVLFKKKAALRAKMTLGALLFIEISSSSGQNDPWCFFLNRKWQPSGPK